MFSTLLVCLCPSLIPVQEKKPAPSEEQVAATCAALEKALAKEAKAADALPVLRSALEVVDARVIEVIDAKGLHHDDLDVRGAAVEALGRMNHPAALKALHE